MSEPSEDRVERYAKAMRDVVGVARVSVFSGEFMDEFGRTVGYVGDSGAIFDDYARAAIAVADAERVDLTNERVIVVPKSQLECIDAADPDPT